MGRLENALFADCIIAGEIIPASEYACIAAGLPAREPNCSCVSIPCDPFIALEIPPTAPPNAPPIAPPTSAPFNPPPLVTPAVAPPNAPPNAAVPTAPVTPSADAAIGPPKIVAAAGNATFATLFTVFLNFLKKLILNILFLLFYLDDLRLTA